MKRKKYLLFIILTIVSGLVGGAVSNYVFMARPAIAEESDLFNRLKSPGLQPYTLTRIEWLITHFETHYSYRFSDYGFDLGFTFKGDEPETIIISCLYLPTADRVKVNKAINQRKSFLKQYAENRGWQDWLKIKEDVEMMEYK